MKFGLNKNLSGIVTKLVENTLDSAKSLQFVKKHKFIMDRVSYRADDMWPYKIVKDKKHKTFI